jgi:RNA polymerase sigma factor (sigma-70 family)
MDLPLDTDVLAARMGDRDAFARLVTRYRSLVTSISLATVGNVAASEDVAQDVFFAAWRDLRSLRKPSSFLPWLRQLARHRSLDAARAGRRPDRRGFDDEASLEAATDPRLNAQLALIEGERAHAVAVALDALPDDAREVITLYYREGQSIEQVARLLGLREDAAKKRLSRARAALREEVLARFADRVEDTAPDDDFTSRVMVALPVMSPVAGALLAKGLVAFIWKGAVAAITSVVAGISVGGIAALGRLRRDLRSAVDDRARRELRLISIVELTNMVLFGVATANLPHAHGVARARLGIAYTIVFSAITFAIYLGWYPRAKARTRRAQVLADPSLAARHAREDRRGRLSAAIAAALVLATLVFIWRYG